MMSLCVRVFLCFIKSVLISVSIDRHKSSLESSFLRDQNVREMAALKVSGLGAENGIQLLSGHQGCPLVH